MTTTTMYALFHQECYEGAALIAVSSSVAKLEARKAYLLGVAGKPYSEIPKDLWKFNRVRDDELFIETVEVL